MPSKDVSHSHVQFDWPQLQKCPTAEIEHLLLLFPSFLTVFHLIKKGFAIEGYLLLLVSVCSLVLWYIFSDERTIKSQSKSAGDFSKRWFPRFFCFRSFRKILFLLPICIQKLWWQWSCFWNVVTARFVFCSSSFIGFVFFSYQYVLLFVCVFCSSSFILLLRVCVVVCLLLLNTIKIIMLTILIAITVLVLAILTQPWNNNSISNHKSEE